MVTSRLFLVTLCVILHKTKPFRKQTLGHRSLIVGVGYYRVFAVAAASGEDAYANAAAMVEDGNVLAAESEVRDVDLASLDPAIAAHYRTPLQPGVWYTGGRIYFPGEDIQDTSLGVGWRV